MRAEILVGLFKRWLEQFPGTSDKCLDIEGKEALDRETTDLVIDVIESGNEVREKYGILRWTEDDLIGIIRGIFHGFSPESPTE